MEVEGFELVVGYTITGFQDQSTSMSEDGTTTRNSSEPPENA